MLRGTVRKVHALGDVSVTLDGKYGVKSLIRMKSRVPVDVGERVFVEDVSPLPDRAHDWVLFGRLTEIGQWATPAPHTHPVGQVTGLVDWLSKYETWMGDHEKRMSDAEARIKAGADAVADARAVLAETRTDLADAVKRVAVQEVFADKASARLDQAERDIRAGGDRIGATEAAIQSANDSLESAKTRTETVASDLSVLTGTVGDVATRVTESERKANDALVKASSAQVSADGKTTITRALEPRTTQPGTAVGDTHFTMSSMDGSGVVTRQQRWDGSAWQDETVGHQVLASLDLGKATVGELDGIRIKANTVTAAQLLVGIGDNYVPDPFFQAPAAWTVPGWIDPKAEGHRSKGALVVPAGTTQRGAYMVNRGNLPASRRVRFSVWVTSPVALQVGHVRVFMRIYKADGSWVFGVPAYVDNSQDIAANTWGQVTGEFVAPEDGATFMVGLFVQAAATNTARFSEMQVVGLTEGSLIVNGTVTGDKVEAQSVAAKTAQFLTVSAMTGVFTKSLTAADAKLLGQTVADSFTANKVAARDIIATGTVDLAQLNVTGPMSASIINASDISARRAFFTEGLTAENATLLGQTVADNLVVSDTFAARVVNAMSTNTKQLVVTDDAILNRATIVQSLVTPELITQKADIGVLAASMITSGALQTSTAANRGVKIDNAGIRAWDDTGQQTIRLNGADNLVQGTFQTGTTGARIKVDAVDATAFMDLYGNSGGLDHGTIYYEAAVPGKTEAALTLTAVQDYATNRSNPSLRLFADRGSFAFQGIWAGNTDPLKFIVLQSTGGLAPNGYATIRVPYITAFPTVAGTTRVPVMSVESASGADVMATIVSQTQTAVIVNVVNKSSGKASGMVVVKIATFVTDMQW